MKKKTRFASITETRWAFYEAKDADDLDSMADWFETLYMHYQNRGKRIKQIHASHIKSTRGKKQ